MGRHFICACAALLLVAALAFPALAEPVTIMVSAAGDCTLGGDANTDGETRFKKKLRNAGGDYGYFLELVRPIFEADDLTVVNLEGPLTTAKKKRGGRGFNFRGDPEYAQILSLGGVDVVTLANNHTRDFETRGLTDTLAALDAAGIGYFGYQNVCIREVQGVKVGFAGFYQNDADTVGEVLTDLRGQCDVMIASFHWGEESSNRPTRKQMNLARAAIDSGADVVLGHHPHVMQGIEKYAGKPIAYSLGNFCFGGNGNPRDKDTFILRCAFTLENGVLLSTDLEIIPCSISSEKGTNNFQPMPLYGDDARRVMNRLHDYSKKFEVPGVSD